MKQKFLTTVRAWVLIPLISAPAVARASTLFTDDFNRPDSASLGTDWVDGRHDWRVTNNRAGGRRILADGSGQNAIVTFVAPGSTMNSDFILNVDATAPNFSTFVGVAFHIQDTNNFFAFRFNNGLTPAADSVEFVKFVNGTPIVSGGGFSVNPGFDITLGTFYDLTVESYTPGVFSFRMTDGVNTFISTNRLDLTYSGGQAGLFGFLENVGTDNVMGDNFSLALVPEPSVAMLFITGLGLMYKLRRGANKS